MNNLGTISLNNRSAEAVVIDIEGIIGMPEEWQFESEDERVATYARFRQTLEHINNLEAKSVRVNIRSMGGNVNDALLIYDALCMLNARVETYCYGYVASAATIVAQAAKGGLRKISSTAFYLIHCSTTAVEGNSLEARQTAQLLDKTDSRIANIYAMRSGYDVEEFEELMSRNSGRGEWLTAEEAVAAGLADSVIESSPLARIGRRVGGFVRSLLSPDVHDTESSMDRVEKLEVRCQSIEMLVNRVVELESENAALKAMPTMTIAKEDPAIDLFSTPLRSVNAGAYAQDAEIFRSSLV